MSAGFQAWGDHGFQQIDGNYRNLRLVAHGLCASNSQSTSGAGMYFGEITVSQQAPVVAFRCSSYCLPLQNNLGNGSFTYRFATKGAATVEYFIFSPEPPSSPSNAGLQVYNENGQLVFDANDRVMKVIDFYTVDVSYVREYGRRIAVCANFSTASRNTQIAQGVRSVYANSYMARTPGETQVQHDFPEIVRMNYNGGWPRSSSSLTSYLIVDVTGL